MLRLSGIDNSLHTLRRPSPHKRGPLSVNISKNYLVGLSLIDSKGTLL